MDQFKRSNDKYGNNHTGYRDDRHGVKFCDADIFKSINIGQTVLLEHGKKSLVILNVRDSRRSKAFREMTEAEKEAPIAPIEKAPMLKRKLGGAHVK